FKERDAAHVAAKAKRMAPIVDAAMARKERHAPDLPDGYHFPAMPRKMVDAAGSKEGKEWLDKFAESSATGDATSAFQLNQ
ncbi:MAG: hypothetical protein ABL966_16730, partial [Acidimicrobiales bacterium]